MPDGRPRSRLPVEINEVPDVNDDGAIDLSDVEYLLRNDANVADAAGRRRRLPQPRSASSCSKQADIVVTNPPFSLFREYVAQLVEHDKKFLILGNQNAITYKEIFPLSRTNKLWLGYENGGDKWFRVPDDYELKTESRKQDRRRRQVLRAWEACAGSRTWTPPSATRH